MLYVADQSHTRLQSVLDVEQQRRQDVELTLTAFWVCDTNHLDHLFFDNLALEDLQSYLRLKLEERSQYMMFKSARRVRGCSLVYRSDIGSHLALRNHLC